MNRKFTIVLLIGLVGADCFSRGYPRSFLCPVRCQHAIGSSCGDTPSIECHESFGEPMENPVARELVQNKVLEEITQAIEENIRKAPRPSKLEPGDDGGIGIDQIRDPNYYHCRYWSGRRLFFNCYLFSRGYGASTYRFERCCPCICEGGS